MRESRGERVGGVEESRGERVGGVGERRREEKRERVGESERD